MRLVSKEEWEIFLGNLEESRRLTRGLESEDHEGGVALEMHGHGREEAALEHGAAEGGDEHPEAEIAVDGVVGEEGLRHLERGEEARGRVEGDYGEGVAGEVGVRCVRNLSQYGGCVQHCVNVQKPDEEHIPNLKRAPKEGSI